MQNGYNTYGDISPRVGVKADKRLLKTGQPLLVSQRFAQQTTQERNSGLTRIWRRYDPLPVVSAAPLGEIVTPTGDEMTFTDYTATLETYGGLVRLTKRIKDTHEDPVLREYTDKCAEQMARVIELVTWERLKAGSNVFRAGSVASRTLINSKISRGELRQIKRQLERSWAMPFTSIIATTPATDTKNVEAGFYAIIHPDLESDVRDLTNFIHVAQYGNKATATEGEVGACEGFRFVKTTELKPWLAAGVSGSTYLTNGAAGSGAADVYPVIVLARDAYACVRLQGDTAGASIKVLNPGEPRGGDPLGQRGSVGWICYYACAITNELWMCRYEVACTASPS